MMLITVKVLNDATGEEIRSEMMEYGAVLEMIENLINNGASLLVEDTIEEGYYYYACVICGNERYIFEEEGR